MAIQHIFAPRYGVPEILEESSAAQLAIFLSQDIPLNLFQLSWLENYGIDSARGADAFIFVGVRTLHGTLAAAALLVGRSLALVHSAEDAAAEALGRWCRDQGFRLDHIVSARRSVERFWHAYAAGRGVAREADDARAPRSFEQLRAHSKRAQMLYTLEPTDADAAPAHAANNMPPIHPRLARLDELDAVFLASARMHREETQIDPLGDDPDAFRRHVAHRISTGRCYVHFDPHRRLLFKAELSALSRFGAQISGVHTDPIFRRKGVATAALFDICGQLFEGGVRRITLYVNDDNEPAHRVYRKVGFKLHAPYQTIFV